MLVRLMIVLDSTVLILEAMMVRSGFGVAPELKERVRMRLCRATLELQRHHQNADQRKKPKSSLRLR